MSPRLAPWLRAGLGLFLLVAACAAEADTVVIVAAASPVSQMSRQEVVNVFMGRYRLVDGMPVQPVEPGLESPARAAFYRGLLGKSVSEIRAYWARLVFSGRTAPPDELRGESEVLDRVGRDPAAVGYVSRQSLTPRVRVVYVVGEGAS